MTEIPEHLRKRAEEARKKASEKAGGDVAPADTPAAGADAPAAGEGGGEPAAPSEAQSRIPAHLLERSKAAKAAASGQGEAPTDAPSTAPAVTAAAGAVATAAPPVAAGPGGHTQRLLTVVKSGSIQDVRAEPVDKVHVWPHLLVVEFVAALAMTAFLLVFSTFVNAPLQPLANVNRTPNPSKAPWYFLGLQELLTMFHPMVAGVPIAGAARRRDTGEAIGDLSRETRKRDKSAAALEVEQPADGRAVEKSAALERREPSTEVVKASAGEVAPWVPPDPETLGVSRRQFLNRGIVTLMSLSLAT